ncbi:MAG: stage II sporulation protein M [Firmicutes bacterium]|nr:stage II sporulation protein M [Bacillota bacterium]
MFVAGRLADILVDYVRKRAAILVFFSVILTMGIISGWAAAGSMERRDRDGLLFYFRNFFQSMEDGSLSATFPHREAAKQAISDNLVKTMGTMWILGLSVVGAPLVLVVVFLRGFILGFSTGFLVNELMARGAMLAAVSVMPHTLLLLPAVVVAGAQSAHFALVAGKAFVRRGRAEVHRQFLGTSVVMAVSGLVLILAGLTEVYVTPVLIRVVGRYFV